MTHASGWAPWLNFPGNIHTPRACMLVDECSFRPSIHFGEICCRQIDLFALDAIYVCVFDVRLSLRWARRCRNESS